jgi:hypothetical protein
MVAFYPYITVSTTIPYVHDTTLQAAQSKLTPVITHQNGEGTSLSIGDIIGIIAAVLVLFSGLAWFAYHALTTLPQRKRMLLHDKLRRKKVGGRGGEVV